MRRRRRLFERDQDTHAPDPGLADPGALVSAYDPENRGTLGAMPTGGIYSLMANANGPINEAAGGFSKYNLASNPVYNENYGGGDGDTGGAQPEDA